MSLEIWTYQDVVEHVLDVFDIDRTNRNLRLARSSVLATYRDMPNRNRWSYYDRHYVLLTFASQTSGTIEYDHTGGSAERLVTLTGSTWPAWAEHGKVVVNDVHYEVDKRLSSTTISLREDSNPGADVAAGGSYTIYRNAYPLPSNFRKLSQIWDRQSSRELPLLTSDVANAELQFLHSSPGTPLGVTIRHAPESQGGLSLQFSPPPSSAIHYEVLYLAKGRDLVTEKYSTGTASVTSGSATVAGSGTSWSASHVGCLMRFSSNGSTEPTSRIGVRTDNVDNPAHFEAIVKSVESATSLTLHEAPTSSLSAVKYTLSDPIDLESGAMFTAFERLAEADLARQLKRNDYEKWVADAVRQLRLAIESDSRAEGSPIVSPYTWFRHGEITTQ